MRVSLCAGARARAHARGLHLLNGAAEISADESEQRVQKKYIIIIIIKLRITSFFLSFALPIPLSLFLARFDLTSSNKSTVPTKSTDVWGSLFSAL